VPTFQYFNGDFSPVVILYIAPRNRIVAKIGATCEDVVLRKKLISCMAFVFPCKDNTGQRLGGFSNRKTRFSPGLFCGLPPRIVNLP